jgi:hypothetical protein
MSWSGLTNNQIVSDTNLANAVATGVFAAKTSIPSTGRELTTTAAVGYAYVDVTVGRASNQLVTKDSLSAANVGPGPYNYYVYGVDGNTMYQSTNGGFTFASYTALPFGQNYTVLAASSTGQYLLAASNTNNNTIYISNDYGVTFNSKNIPNLGGGGVVPFTTFYPCDADMSSSGQYMVVVGKTQPGSSLGQVTVAISSDYGANFLAYFGAYSGDTYDRASVAMSQNGAVICYVASRSSFTAQSQRYTSTNYGASFTFGGFSNNQLFYDVSMSSTGQYILIVNHGTASTGNFFVSSNYGSSYTSRSTAGGGAYSGMTSSGTIMQVGTDTGGGWYSTNNGVNWSQYSVIYYFYPMIGMAVGDLFTVPMVSNYLAIFQSTYCNYKPESSSTTFYAQPLTYAYSINKIYRKAINY